MKRGFTLLLVEDDNTDVQLFRHALDRSSDLTGLRIRLETAYDGEEAIQYLKGKGSFANRFKHPFPDLIVTDLKMPRLNGLDVLAWLKKHPEYHRVPKILLSASSLESDVDQAYRLGVNTFFQKPSTLADFQDLVYHMVCYWAHTQRAEIRHHMAA